MPCQSTMNTDNLDSLVRFEASPLHDMLVALESLSNPWCPADLARRTEAVLGPGFRESLRELYRPFHAGIIIAELAFARDDLDDVPAFFQWVENLPDREFAWHILGRVPELESMPETITPRVVETLTDHQGRPAASSQWYLDLSWSEDISAFRSALVDHWRRFWEAVFLPELPSLEPRWEAALKDFVQRFQKEGLKGLLEGKIIPDPIPEGMPYRRISVVPSCHFFLGRHILYYGWGKVTLILDASGSRDLRRQGQARAGELESVFKAMGESNRLKILHFIAINERAVNGKWLAAKLKLSPSVTSRHLSQLKAAGLISEHTEDNRNYTYSPNYGTIRGLSKNLEAYLLGTVAEILDDSTEYLNQ